MNLIYLKEYRDSSKPVVLNLLLNERELGIVIKLPTLRSTWRYAGTLSRFVGHPSRPSFLESWTIGFALQVIQLPMLQNPYQLSFSPASWLGIYSLSLWKSPMGIYVDPGAIANAVATSTVAATNAAAGAVILPANPSRKSFTVNNTSTGTLYLGYGSTPTAAAFDVAIPPRGFFDPNISFSGEIKGLWTNNNGNAIVKEFT